MVRKRRGFSAFSLAFLDIMSCGFGAVVLLFLIIKHHADVKDVMPAYDLGVELGLLEQDIGDAQVKLGQARSRASNLDADLLSKKELAELARQELAKARAAAQDIDPSVTNDELAAMKSQLQRLEEEKDRLQQQVNKQANSVRTFVGAGNREYLTGLKLGGRRILILLDASASMLDDTIVNVIRRRNMDDATKRRSWKWQQGIATVDWISARFPPNAKFQIYTFNTQAKSVLPGTDGKWLDVSNLKVLNEAVSALGKVVPGGGSSLINAFGEIQGLSPLPDNVFLITDGLPTQGQTKPRSTTVGGVERQRLFERAVDRLPRGIPVNSILLPMEGDPSRFVGLLDWLAIIYTRGILNSRERLAMRLTRRGNEPISIAFLDVMTCGFGAIILLLMIAKFGDPPAPEDTVDPRRAQISALQRDLFNLRRDVSLAEQALIAKQDLLETFEDETKRLQRAKSALAERQEGDKTQAQLNAVIAGQLKTAQQQLTEEMQRLYAQKNRKRHDLIGGIPVDSEYIIFIIDTSGSMFRYAWPKGD